MQVTGENRWRAALRGQYGTIFNAYGTRFLVEEGPEYTNGLERNQASCVDFRNVFWCSHS